jgi:hypothetical protein
MSPKLALLSLAGALSLSGCYYVPYGYYPSYPPPLTGTYQTQPGVASGPADNTNTGAIAAGQQNQQYDSTNAGTQQQYAQAQTPPAVGYAPYPAYYPAYPAYAAYPGYYGGYGYPYGYGYAPNVSIGLGFGWGGGWGRGGWGGYHGGGHGWHGH